MCCMLIKSNFVIILIKVIVICFLSLIPWPGPSVFKISCSRDSARVVRKIVQSKWIPILEKYQVKLPLECPFHPLRDIFGPQQLAKIQNRPSQWTCGFCGKSFFEEKHLDVHFENRHKNNINVAEDAICLADYCDMMRCEVLISQDATLSFGDSTMSTDIEVWNEATAYRTALTPSTPRDLAKVPQSRKNNILPSILQNKIKSNDASKPTSKRTSKKTNEKHCDKNDNIKFYNKDNQSSKNKNNKFKDSLSPGKDDDEDEDDDDEEDDENDEENDSNTTSCDKHLVDSALPPVDSKQQRISELQKMKANCKSEELEKLKNKCEILVRDCIAGLLVELSLEDFKNMEDELNKAVCWYLTCDRYWEDGQQQKHFPWGLVFILIMVLSLGVSLCYYIIWVLFETDDPYSTFTNIPSHNNLLTAHSSPIHPHHSRHHLHHQQSLQSQQHILPQTSISTTIYHQSSLPSSSTTNNPPASSLLQKHSSSVNISSIEHHNQQPKTSPQQHQQQQQQQSVSANQPGYSEEFFPTNDFNNDLTGQSEHYIYVTYPPELKRRLLESCYNRTTRL